MKHEFGMTIYVLFVFNQELQCVSNSNNAYTFVMVN